MNLSQHIVCEGFACAGVRPEEFWLPEIEVDPQSISLVLISEAAPAKRADGYYAGPEALFAKTTLLAFNEAGIEAASIDELLQRGVYLTTAVKCAKTGYTIDPRTVKTCSNLLERELALFPQLKAILLMGDAAIQAINAIAKRQGEPRVIPAGSTYKIRGGEFTYRGARAFPSYLQAGPSYYIEKSKRKMIAEDIRAADTYANGSDKIYKQAR